MLGVSPFCAAAGERYGACISLRDRLRSLRSLRKSRVATGDTYAFALAEAEGREMHAP